MHNSYHDIRSRITEEPKWFDSNGVPRYSRFRPQDVPNIYANEAVLYLIRCQACHVEFAVAQEEYGATILTHGSIADRITGKLLHYGDPPCHGCSGDTMNCEDIRVLGYWHRSSEQVYRGIGSECRSLNYRLWILPRCKMPDFDLADARAHLLDRINPLSELVFEEALDEIERLRTKIDQYQSRKYPILVVCALIIHDGKVLLERHAPSAEYSSPMWDIPGGKVEVGETPHAAVIREIREEMQITIEPLRLVPVLYDSVWTDRDGTRAWILAVYECQIVEGVPPLSDTLRWLDVATFNQSEVKTPDYEIVTSIFSYHNRIAELEAEVQRWKRHAQAQSKSLSLALDGQYLDAD